MAKNRTRETARMCSTIRPGEMRSILGLREPNEGRIDVLGLLQAPPSDGPEVPLGPKPPSGLERGGQPGHRGHKRALEEQPDEIKE